MDRRTLEAAASTGFTQPHPFKVQGPLIDIHTHATPRPETQHLFRAATLYGVQTLVVITRELFSRESLQDGWAGEVELAPSLTYEYLHDPPRFARENLDRLEAARRVGARVIKFWFAPRFYATTRLRLDDERLEPIFARMEAEGLLALVHVSDPDRWFERVYTDPALYGTKADQYPQLERVLARHPRLRVIAAHMGGDPEHLDHLQDLLDRYPNLYLDTSATKWIVRELGRQREAARAFITKNSHRLVFGTDQVVTEQSDLVRYTSRYWTHRVFWETDIETPSPVEDPDADGVPLIRGLDLPEPTLVRLYHDNARALLAGQQP